MTVVPIVEFNIPWSNSLSSDIGIPPVGVDCEDGKLASQCPCASQFENDWMLLLLLFSFLHGNDVLCDRSYLKPNRCMFVIYYYIVCTSY